MVLVSSILSVLLEHDTCTAIGVGVFIHNLVFIKGEWHLKAPHIVICHILLFITLGVFDVVARYMTFSSAIMHATKMMASYLIAVLLSMSLYRCYFHRLRDFPGPPLARITKLWHAYYCLGSQNHLFLHDIYKRYGQFVRTGPSEITVFHPDIHHITDSQGNTCTKSVWYDMMTPELSVVSVRDKKVHDMRRRIWDRGFDSPSLKYYDQRVLLHVKQLMEIVDRAAATETPVTVNRIFYWFGWDVMSDVIFGKPFRMLQDEKHHSIVIQLKRAMSLLGPISPVPWLAHIGFAFIPGVWVVKDWFETIDLCRRRMQDRVNMGNRNRDVSSQIVIDAEKHGFRDVDKHWLTGDAVLAVMAGSDTVTGTLVALFYRLAEDPERMEKLFAEVADIDVTDIQALSTLPFLDALINETLRLHPALPSGGARETGPDGIMVGDTFIPGNTTIIAPKYSIGRMECCFEHAEAFIPERWTSRPEMVKDIRGFTPFGVGRYGCVGKNLALSELRFVAASLAKAYHIRFAPGEDGHRFEKEMRDYFTPKPGQVDVVFTRRCGKA